MLPPVPLFSTYFVLRICRQFVEFVNKPPEETNGAAPLPERVLNDFDMGHLNAVRPPEVLVDFYVNFLLNKPSI